MIRTVTAVRFVMPLREGGSLPGLVEADDDGLYVVKLRGAGQGPPVLVAELLAAELARAAGLPVPEVVKVELDPALGRNEADAELRALLLASGGLNLGLDFLPGAATFDPAADPPPAAAEASRIVLFDAATMNPDRTARNPNLLRWQGRTWLIDHGAAFYFHYTWQPSAPLAGSDAPFARIREHVLAPWATDLAGAAKHLGDALDAARIRAMCAELPDSWLVSDHAALPSREQYADWLAARVAALPYIAEEAARALAHLV